jgi:hypothetical protein
MKTLKKYNEIKMNNNNSDNNNSIKTEERIISKFFNLKNTYLSFIDCNDDNDENGTNNEKYLILNASNGKSKILISEFAEDLNILNPNVAILPFEYVSYLFIIILFLFFKLAS